MALVLYYHPFSSYSWKVLIPLYEAGTTVTLRNLEDPAAAEEWKRLWPLARFPILVDDTRNKMLPEASIIIEYLDRHYPGPMPMLPTDEETRLEVRLLDRFFDNYVSDPLQKIVFDRRRDAGERDAKGVEEACDMLTTAYGWLDAHLAHGKGWAVGASFTLADCAAAPSLFYADWVHPIGTGFPTLAAYRARLLARPSVARAVDDARPYRGYFPGGAPDRD
jgi:glutathione S-transferase